MTAHSCCGPPAPPQVGSPSHQPRGPCLRCSHGEKGAPQTKRREFKPSGDLGPQACLLWA